MSRIPITYLRSSSYGAWDFCQQKYLIDYILSYRSPANKKADKGTIVHKALELLAKFKLALQEKKIAFTDEELKVNFTTASYDIHQYVELAYNHFSRRTADIYDWLDSDRDDCHQWTVNALSFNDGMFNPLYREIVSPELYFDFEIMKPWAEYDYLLPNGKRLLGHLALKGTTDLIVRVPDNAEMLEMIDWKTGKRKDILTGKEKGYEELQKDPQLRIYHYAVCKLFPKIKQFVVTIFFINDGGPFTLYFDKTDLARTEKMLEERFDKIKNTVRPQLIYPNWKCKYLCWFSKHDVNNNEVDDYNKSCCKEIRDNTVKLGLDKVLLKYGDLDKLSNYGGGGGRYDVGS
jgi:hypothetical protein